MKIAPNTNSKAIIPEIILVDGFITASFLFSSHVYGLVVHAICLPIPAFFFLTLRLAGASLFPVRHACYVSNVSLPLPASILSSGTLAPLSVTLS